MKAPIFSAIALMFIGATSTYAAEPIKTVTSSAPKVLLSGIDSKHNDASIKAQDDFYRHVNGKWLKASNIPADKSSAGAFMDLREATIPRLHAITEALAKQHPKPGSDAQKISDLYSSFMDTTRIGMLGLKPLESDFAKVSALSDKKQIPAFIAYLNLVSVGAPFDIGIHQDNKDSTKYVLDVVQSGLGMPDRDYYLNNEDAKLKDTRAKYLKHIEKMFTLAGDKDATKNATDILALETELAKAQWTK
ncbi:MAG: M13 family metallopeptidase N-terminal domain-containing protein, partial [Undibacterium sp.]|nr:M13 family metallopeptidase N-terminal domain-containing protein [Undibacterium sp.]